jgi:hypothetical protein
MATEDDFKRIGNYARMYNVDQNIDRRNAHRTVPMEVLCLGYSRTGTLSMQKALTILGYPNTYHFSAFYDNVRDCDLWIEAMNAKFNGKGKIPDKAFFDGLLGHVGAVTDAPCILFGKELMEFYPDAKVVLVEREMGSWYKSWMAFCDSAFNPALSVLGFIDPYWMGRITAVGNAIIAVQTGFSKNIDEARVRSKDAYRHHYRDVKEMTPSERLLEFKLGSGWEPLCEFLGKPIPVKFHLIFPPNSGMFTVLILIHQNIPFPHENEQAANKQGFVEMGQMSLKHAMKNALLGTAIVGAPLIAIYWYWK